jgi:hypothetical protein
MNNPYALFTDKPDWQLATQAIDEAITQSVGRHPELEAALQITRLNVFYQEVYPLMQRYRSCGATDTQSRDQAFYYFQNCYESTRY